MDESLLGEAILKFLQESSKKTRVVSYIPMYKTN